MVQTPGAPSRGILHPRAGETKFRLSQHAPAQDLARFVEFYWIVAWDLRGQEPFVQETLPYPCVHLVFEQGNTMVYGIPRGRFRRLLEGQGSVLGIKFRPGAFYPFTGIPVSTLRGKEVGFEEIFGAGASALERDIFRSDDPESMILPAQGFLRARLPGADETAELAGRIVEHIAADPEIKRVDQIAERFGTDKRRLQDIFRRYVGVGPKWVIQRYRLQEAAERLAKDGEADLAALALELGYFDQAHFTRDFKAIIGQTPAEYATGQVPP